MAEIWYLQDNPGQMALAALATTAGAMGVPFTSHVSWADIMKQLAVHTPGEEIWLIGPRWREHMQMLDAAVGDDDIVVMDHPRGYESLRRVMAEYYPINRASGLLGHILTEDWVKPEFHSMAHDANLQAVVRRVDAYIDNLSADDPLFRYDESYDRFMHRFVNLYAGVDELPPWRGSAAPVTMAPAAVIVPPTPGQSVSYRMEVREAGFVLAVVCGATAEGCSFTVTRAGTTP